MAVQVSWHNTERTILRYGFQDLWTWDEYFPALARGRDMMRSVSHHVCILNDFTGAAHIPGGFLNHALDIIATRPANTGLAVFVSHHSMFKSLYDLLARLYPELAVQYLLYDNQEDAIKKLTHWLYENQIKHPFSSNPA